MLWYAQCDVPGVEEDEVTVFLAMTLINKTPQDDGVKVIHPDQNSDCDKVRDPDEKKGLIACFYTYFSFYIK